MLPHFKKSKRSGAEDSQVMVLKLCYDFCVCFTSMEVFQATLSSVIASTSDAIALTKSTGPYQSFGAFVADQMSTLPEKIAIKAMGEITRVLVNNRVEALREQEEE